MKEICFQKIHQNEEHTLRPMQRSCENGMHVNVSVSIPSKMISNNCAAERNPTPAGLPTIFQCCIVHATRMGLATTVSSPKSLALGTDVLAIFIFPWVGAQ